MRLPSELEEPPMPRFHTLSVGLGAVLGLVLPVALVGPVAAEKLDSGPINFEDTFVVNDFCGVTGLDVQGHVTNEGRFLTRLVGKDSIFYYMDHVRTVLEWTNLDTGQQATDISRNVTSKDLRITVNDDGTITIVELFTGPDALYGDNGKLIAKNDGQIRLQTVLDYHGTLSDPSDDTFVSEKQIFGSTGTNDDFCAAILDDWGITP